MAVTDVLPVDPSFVVPEKLIHNVLTTEMFSGQEQRKQKWANPKRSWKVSTQAMTNTELDSMRSFWIARAGPFDTFIFLPPTNFDRLVTGLACGTGDGTTTVFTIGNSATPPYYYKVLLTSARNKVYLGGVSQGSGWTLSNNDGTKLSSVTFTTAPTNGQVVTVDIDRYLVARFLANEFTLQLEHYGIGRVDYEMLEVLRSSI